MDPDYQTRLADADQKREKEAQKKIAQLDQEAKLLPLKRKILAYIESFMQWIDLSVNWFLKARDMSLSKEEKQLSEVIYQFYKKRSDLILNELSDFAPGGLSK